MKCQVLKVGDTTAIVCSRGKRWKKCQFCGRGASLLCDGAKASGPRGTCDADLCATCAVHVGTDRDLCPRCAKVPQQLELGQTAGAP